MARGWYLVLVGQIVISPALSAQTPTPARWPVRPVRVALEAVLGTVGSVAGGYVGARIGATLRGPRGGEDPGLLGAIIGTIVGVPLGSAAGVYLGARSVNQAAKFSAGLRGAGMGMASFLLIRPLAQLDPDYPSFWVAFLGLNVAGAVLFEEIGIRNRKVRLEIAPGVRGVRFGARVNF